MTRWNSVEDEPPKHERTVWTWSPGFARPHEGYYLGGYWYGHVWTPTHWAEIDWPELPEEAK